MNNKTLMFIGLAAILVVLVIIAFSGDSAQAPSENDPQNQNGDQLSIMADHQYSEGVHTVSGTFYLPTPCHDLETQVQVAESFPEQVTIDFSVVEPGVDEICIQVIDEREFTVEFQASAEAHIGATVNGQSANLVIAEENNN